MDAENVIALIFYFRVLFYVFLLKLLCMFLEWWMYPAFLFLKYREMASQSIKVQKDQSSSSLLKIKDSAADQSTEETQTSQSSEEMILEKDRSCGGRIGRAFPVITSWPVFTFFIFLGFPGVVSYSAFRVVDERQANFLIYRQVYQSEIGKPYDDLYVASNVLIWVGTYFLNIKSFGYALSWYNGIFPDYCYEYIPTSLHKLMIGRFRFGATVCYLAGLATGVSHVILGHDDQKGTFGSDTNLDFNHEFPKEFFYISLVVSFLFALDLLHSGFKGLYVLLSLVYLDFLANWEAFVYLVDLLLLGCSIYFLYMANHVSGLGALGCYVMFFLFPLVPIVTVVAEHIRFEFDFNQKTEFLFSRQNPDLRLVSESLIIRKKGIRKYAQIGQKINIYDPGFFAMVPQSVWVRDAVVLLGTNQSKWRFDKTTLEMERGGYAAYFLRDFSWCTEKLYCLLTLPFICLHMLLFTPTQCCTTPMDVFSKNNKEGKTSMFMLNPSGRGIGDYIFEESPRDVFKRKSEVSWIIFVADAPGIDSALCHLFKCLKLQHKKNKDIFPRCGFVFHCSSHYDILRILETIFRGAEQNFYCIDKKRRIMNEVNVSFVLPLKLKEREFKLYVDRLLDECIASLAKVLIIEGNLVCDYAIIKKRLLGFFVQQSSIQHKHSKGSTQQHPVSSILLCAIGSSKNLFATQDLARSIKADNKNVKLLEAIYEDHLGNMPRIMKDDPGEFDGSDVNIEV